jgi:Ca2+/H+ antiporter
MDQDQDILDKLDLEDGPRLPYVVLLIAGLALVAGALSFLTLRFQLVSSKEASADGAVLMMIGACVALTIAYRKFR